MMSTAELVLLSCGLGLIGCVLLAAISGCMLAASNRKAPKKDKQEPAPAAGIWTYVETKYGWPEYTGEDFNPTQLRAPKVHRLKSAQPGFDQLRFGGRNFEVRKNDRDYQVGDLLLLEEHNPEPGEETAEDPRIIAARVHHVMEGGQFGIEAGYVVMGIEVI